MSNPELLLPLPYETPTGNRRPARKPVRKRRLVANTALRGADPLALPTDNVPDRAPVANAARVSAVYIGDTLPY